MPKWTRAMREAQAEKVKAFHARKRLEARREVVVLEEAGGEAPPIVVEKKNWEAIMTIDRDGIVRCHDAADIWKNGESVTFKIGDVTVMVKRG